MPAPRFDYAQTFWREKGAQAARNNWRLDDVLLSAEAPRVNDFIREGYASEHSKQAPGYSPDRQGAT